MYTTTWGVNWSPQLHYELKLDTAHAVCGNTTIDNMNIVSHKVSHSRLRSAFSVQSGISSHTGSSVWFDQHTKLFDRAFGHSDRIISCFKNKRKRSPGGKILLFGID